MIGEKIEAMGRSQLFYWSLTKIEDDGQNVVAQENEHVAWEQPIILDEVKINEDHDSK